MLCLGAHAVTVSLNLDCNISQSHSTHNIHLSLRKTTTTKKTFQVQFNQWDMFVTGISVCPINRAYEECSKSLFLHFIFAFCIYLELQQLATWALPLKGQLCTLFSPKRFIMETLKEHITTLRYEYAPFRGR